MYSQYHAYYMASTQIFGLHKHSSDCNGLDKLDGVFVSNICSQLAVELN